MFQRAWTWLTDDHVVLANGTAMRHFMRCDTCGRVFFHFWGCAEAGEKAQLGCRSCGGIRARMARLPEWQAAVLVLSCYVWRKLIKGKTYWDPRMPTRVTHVDA